MAWGALRSRPLCQALTGDEDLIVEIPKYTINHAKRRLEKNEPTKDEKL